MDSSTFSKMYPCQLQLSGKELAPFKTASDSRVSSHNWNSKLEAREGKQARGYFFFNFSFAEHKCHENHSGGEVVLHLPCHFYVG